jgi:predicted transcriptional regulator
MKTKAIFVRSTDTYKNKVKGVASILDRDESQFVREAIDEKIAREAKKNQKVAEFLQEATAA